MGLSYGTGFMFYVYEANDENLDYSSSQMNRAAGVAKAKMNSTAKCWHCRHSEFSPTASGCAVHTALGTKHHCHCYWKTEEERKG